MAGCDIAIHPFTILDLNALSPILGIAIFFFYFFPMQTTRASLLIRVRNTQDTAAWSEFYDLYAPILYGFARNRGLQHDDALDVQSACYESIVKQIPFFEYEKQKGGFKAWLRVLVNRRVVDVLRKRKEVHADTHQIGAVESGEKSVEELWEDNWKKQILKHCFHLAKNEVSPSQYEAFRLLVEDNKQVSEVENMTGLNANQIYKAKARVLDVIRKLYESMDE